MKATIRFFNIIIMALAALATAFLFVSPTFNSTVPLLSFNSNVALDVAAVSKFIPATDYTGEIDIGYLLGTDVIHVGLKFEVDITSANRLIGGDRNRINDELVGPPIDNMLDELHKPIDLITEFTVKDVLKKILVEQVTQNAADAIEKFKENNPGVEVNSTVEEMMAEVGMDDAYFTNFTAAIYDTMNVEGKTTDDIVQVMYDMVDQALALADESGIVDTSGYSEDAKSGIQTSLINALNQLKLVNPDNTVKPIGQIAYIYLTDYLKTELTSKVSDPTILEQQTGETMAEYSDRMLTVYVTTMLPDAFYQIVGYSCLGMFVGLFIFAAIWVILFLITLFRTFSNKPWTFFGPWFWILGGLQLVLGVGLTVFGKFILPNIKIPVSGLPIKSFIVAPRTCALIPSLIFGACIILAIVYAILRGSLKREMKAEKKKKDLRVYEN